MFSQWIVDSNGVGLQICTDSTTADGNPPPCFYDPIVPGNALSESLGRGGEAFWYLADNVFASTGAFPIDGVLVYAVESAFLSDPPAAGFQTQFQRMRTRINVSKIGRYIVESPWGNRTYDVTELLPAGNGQNRMEISDPIDITFNPNSVTEGLVAPFLTASIVPAGFAGYIGDGLTPTTVTGSPCGQNFVRVTAFEPDLITPININNGSNVLTSSLFTVMGKLAPTAAVPLVVNASYYTRTAGVDKVTVMAESSASISSFADVTIGSSVVRMAHDATRFYASVPVVGGLPLTVSVTAQDPGRPSTPNTQNSTLRDLVTIGAAEARCSGTGAARNCLLTVNATSSDDGSGTGGAPLLTLAHTGQTLTGGTISTNSAAIPASVIVKSAAGGSATKAVTIINP